jgi:hypothetical protein
MITVGWIIGMMIGGVLAAPLIPALGLAPLIAGILTVVLGPVGALLQPFIGVLSFSLAILVGGLALLVVTVVVYALAAVSLLPLPATGTIATNLVELTCRGILIGFATAANALGIATISGLWILSSVVVLVGLLTTIPPVAASRLVFQPILGLLSWFFILTWLIMPLGIILFLVNLPFALAQSGSGAIRFDSSTMTIETQGGAIVNFLFTLSPLPGAAGFNLGNFTFLSLPPGTAPSSASFTGMNLSAHEVGHTVTVAALGGFFGICNAIDENIPPLARSAAAYGEVIPESHSFNRGLPALPMW